jgi:hypothetical protein
LTWAYGHADAGIAMALKKIPKTLSFEPISMGKREV